MPTTIGAQFDHPSTPSTSRSYTQFVRATNSPRPSDVISSMDVEPILRATQYTLRLCCYLYLRPRDLTRKRRKNARIMLLIVSLLSISRKLINLSDKLRSLLRPRSWTFPTLPDDDRERLKAMARIASSTLETMVDFLDNLSLLRLLPDRYIQLPSMLNLAQTLSLWAETSITKAAVWAEGVQTRKKMLLRDRPGGRSTPPSHEIDQGDWDNSSPSVRTRLERAVHRERRETLKKCRRVLDRIWWMQVGIVCDGVFALYDVLDMQARGEGVRVVTGCASAWISFMDSYHEKAIELKQAQDSQP